MKLNMIFMLILGLAGSFACKPRQDVSASKDFAIVQNDAVERLFLVRTEKSADSDSYLFSFTPCGARLEFQSIESCTGKNSLPFNEDQSFRLIAAAHSANTDRPEFVKLALEPTLEKGVVVSWDKKEAEIRLLVDAVVVSDTDRLAITMTEIMKAADREISSP